ncbi:cardiolipin synthase [Hespellia stercorisuis]|uniref:Cardiolipin synthase n=1 Tax=Hespellia stercorisuis DSM 15480 TaxID=1121950 RepID=A0A1M6VW81_9FIRM|nr:cardiolipin synthase [Hespellia stercorisuis DSM 15480]
MEENTVKKAKKGFLHIVFSRAGMIVILLLLQLMLLFSVTTFLSEYSTIYYVVFNILSVLVVIYIINEKGNPAFNMTWILLVMIFPVFGSLFYIYVKSQLGTRYIGKTLGRIKLETSRYIDQKQDMLEEIRVSKPANANLAHYMKFQLGFPTYRNTKATYFSCGEEKFPAMIRELKKAEKFIFMEYFIVEEGYMWDSVLNVLKEKAEQGVEVRFMYDGMCSLTMLPHNYPKTLQKLGIKCKMFSPIRPLLSTTQNNRDHRKICVVDGKVAITGGINLGDEYINRKERFGYWKDTAIMLEGPAVQSFTMMFLQMWNVTEKSVDYYKQYLRQEPQTELQRELGFVLPYADSPYDNENVGEEVYFHILNHAKKYVHIMTPYLILDNEMLDTLKRAAKSGIEVQIIMPGIPDKWYAFALAKTYYLELMDAGVQIFEFTPGFVHAKVFVSDDDTATVGTVNLDYRSLYLHFECGAFIYNNVVVRDVELDFQSTLLRCRRVTRAEMKKITVPMKVAGRVLRLVAPLM